MGDPPRSPTPDFHNILGISKGASLVDVNKAFKSLVKKWHPDKHPSKKTEAQTKFQAIYEAYKALNIKEEEGKTTPTWGGYSSPAAFSSGSGSRPSSASSSPSGSGSSRRSTTPNSLSTGSSPRIIRTSSSTNFPTSLSKSTSRRSTAPIIYSQSTVPKKPQPIESKLECTLEELCHGCSKKIKITRDVISDTGLIVQEEEILKIKIKPGWRKGTSVKFDGRGDERPGTLPADIIFLIDEKKHPVFQRAGDNLEIGVEIPLVKALTGCQLSVPLLGGEKMSLFIDDIIYPGYEKTIPGQGMPIAKQEGRRGDLNIKFLVSFPMELSDEQRYDVYRILQDSS